MGDGGREVGGEGGSSRVAIATDCEIARTASMTLTSPATDLIASLAELLRGRRIAVLTGAGCSTESGIPDYRGDGFKPRRRPLQYQAFVSEPTSRARYWAGSMAGWHRVFEAVPNPAHEAIAGLERAGVAVGVITQNVDGLHRKAGSERIVELHGSLARVKCLACRAIVSRATLQEKLVAMNADFLSPRVDPAPDGDADVGRERLDRFRVPECEVCGGVLKPDVVFFGENVPKPRVEDAFAILGEADALLVAGSSLAVYSGYRFVLDSTEQRRPVAIVNLGPTRGDTAAAVKVEAKLGEIMPALAALLVAN